MRAVPIDGFPNLLVLFRVSPAGIQILRVLHGAQNIDAMADEILPE